MTKVSISPNCGNQTFQAKWPQQTEAIEFFRKLRGGSQSALVLCSDGNLYAIKFMGNPQGRNVLANEAFSYMLAAEIGLPVPPWAIVHVSAEFLERFPECWPEGPFGRTSPSEGLHFGSRITLHADGSPAFDVLPSNWIHRLDAPDMFMGALLFDIWTLGMDSRQAVFTLDTATRFVHTTFIDFGHNFGGPNGDRGSAFSPNRIPFQYNRVYKGIALQPAMHAWLVRINAIDTKALQYICALVPDEWAPPGWRMAALEILERQKTSLKSAVRTAIRSLGPIPAVPYLNQNGHRHTYPFSTYQRCSRPVV